MTWTNSGDQGSQPESKKKRTWIWFIVAIVGAGILVNFTGTAANRTPPQSRPVMVPVPVTEMTSPDNVAALAIGQADPLVTDGTWFVGSEIEPGVYRAVAAIGAWRNYWRRCADAECRITSGLIQAGGIGLIEIKPTDYAISLEGLVLTRIE